MLSLAITAVLCFAPAQDEEAPDPKRVELAIDTLGDALKGKAVEAKLDAIAAHGEIADKDVVKLVARAIKDKDGDVRKRAIEALRWNPHEHALEQLHTVLKRDRAIAKDDELLPLVIKAIGQHASPTSVELLANNIFERDNHDATRARILGLGHIRSKKSVAALIKVMHTGRREHVQLFMPQIRLSLMVLTAEDHGQSQDQWTKWWNKNKKSFKVSAKAPKLPRDENIYWNSYWGYEYEMARDKRRKKRGSDPEKND